MTHKTQWINQGLFQDQIILIKVPEQKTLRNRYSQKQFECLCFVWTKGSLSSVTPDTLCIIRKNKIKKTPDTLIIRKQPIQEPSNRGNYLVIVFIKYLLIIKTHHRFIYTYQNHFFLAYYFI